LTAGYLSQSIENRARRIGGRGKELEHAELPVCEINAVSKRAARINCYTQDGSLS
jgi:hypothetical protein